MSHELYNVFLEGKPESCFIFKEIFYRGKLEKDSGWVGVRARNCHTNPAQWALHWLMPSIQTATTTQSSSKAKLTDKLEGKNNTNSQMQQTPNSAIIIGKVQ